MNKMKKDTICIVSMFLILLLVLINAFVNLDKSEQTYMDMSMGNEREKVVTSICIEKNSTLWDIATEYYTEDYNNVNELIEEIKTSNGITTDTIQEGQYIIVPHYVAYE